MKVNKMHVTYYIISYFNFKTIPYYLNKILDFIISLQQINIYKLGIIYTLLLIFFKCTQYK